MESSKTKMEEVKSKSSIGPESSSSHPKCFGIGVVPYEEIVFCLSFILGSCQLQLPKEKIDGNPVPTIIFKGQSKTFHSFIVGIILSFCSAITAIYTRDPQPKFASYYRRISVLTMASTLLILFWAASHQYAQTPGFC